MEITKQLLKDLWYIKSATAFVKILWNGDYTKHLKFVDMDAFSASAKDRMENPGKAYFKPKKPSKEDKTPIEKSVKKEIKKIEPVKKEVKEVKKIEPVKKEMKKIQEVKLIEKIEAPTIQAPKKAPAKIEKPVVKPTVKTTVKPIKAEKPVAKKPAAKPAAKPVAKKPATKKPAVKKPVTKKTK